MALTTATTSDYAKILAEEEEYKAKVTDYESLLTGQLQGLSQAAQATSQQTSYDISKAYAASMKQQRSVAQIAGLATGAKEYVKTQIAGAYESEYGDIRTKEQQSLAKLSEVGSDYFAEYMKNIESANTELTKTAKKYAEFEKFAMESLVANDATIDTSKIYQAGEGNTKVLSDYGKTLLDQLMHDATISEKFNASLQAKSPELYDWYRENKSSINKTVAGLDVEDRSYKEGDVELQKLKTINEAAFNKVQSMKFNTTEDQIKFTKAVTEKKDLTYITAGVHDSGAKITTTSGEELYAVPSTLIDTFEFPSDDVKKFLTKEEEAKYTSGDIVTVKGINYRKDSSGKWKKLMTKNQLQAAINKYYSKHNKWYNMDTDFNNEIKKYKKYGIVAK